jgi:hypothetical protein
MDVLAIWHVGKLGIAADAERAIRALLNELHMNLLILQLRLAEAAAKKLDGNVDIRLTQLHFHPIVVDVDDAGLGHAVASNEYAATGCQQER